MYRFRSTPRFPRRGYKTTKQILEYESSLESSTILTKNKDTKSSRHYNNSEKELVYTERNVLTTKEIKELSGVLRIYLDYLDNTMSCLLN